MKSLFKYSIGIFLLLLTGSCQEDFLDQVPDDRLTIEQVFMRRETSEQYLANVYNYIKDESYLTNNAPWIGLSDEGDITYDRPGYLTFLMNIGNWSAASGYYDNYYSDYYKGIRSATTFINNIGGNPQFTPELITRRTAEARFVRAFLYFSLLRTWGPITILGDEVLPGDLDPTDPLLHLPRNSYDECVDYIVSELDLAGQDLPLHWTTQESNSQQYGVGEFGRATKVACMALKSRLLLYAASPLFNGNQEYAGFVNLDGKPLINQQYSAVKWERAAKAAKDIIDLGVLSLYKKNNAQGNFDPLLSYRSVFLDAWNPEVIFARVSNNLPGWERASSPRLASGYASTGPTQQMVDAYYMANGMRPILGYNANGSPIINAQSGYTETGFTAAATKYTLPNTYNMYVNREPRFYANVNYNGAQWINTSEGVKVIQTYNSGESGPAGSWDHSRTGYINRKNVSPAANPRTAVNTARPYLMFRYAEILLNYVEALNETDPGNPDILRYLNSIRERAGIPQFGEGASPLPVPGSQSAMREAIWHERRVELSFEHMRYFDTRRWKIAEQTDAGPFYGMNISADPPAFYNRTVFETRVFRKSYYFFPIPQPEINKNSNLVQNPGY
ncbi:RagB/SusD family nutrient uptake outer membrane protein [Rufibacter immobilis]|uniref:RagB/SusD family nutrient uptake outer membrane protein n=1 Tax=Rufibacter immobilis TaxID=1348778 RepID=A0A3M9N5D3_9BACT|nr:RagB/SusD family nutrient uptake outer membrane protein [Rufibacter immobilis]RNI33020.1 RagB/SusD family nutrient uptake outer membrane protein [Rufibacter immobilis]